jgi:hypothetical protein
VLQGSPNISDFTTGIIAILKRFALEEFPKNLFLEDFDDLQLTTTFQFKPFYFMEFPRVREDCITFLEHFALFLRGRNDHASVGSIDLKENGHFSSLFVFQSVFIY